jgi:hypothetical protein
MLGPVYQHSKESLMITRARPSSASGSLWASHREATLNWLALGMLLAAWNASDNEPGAKAAQRPEALRGYSQVSVRAARQGNVTEL